MPMYLDAALKPSADFLADLIIPDVLPKNRPAASLPIRSIVAGKAPDPQRRALRWNYPDVSGASVETTWLEYKGKKHEVHNNAYVSIVPTNICNANCGFCVIELLKSTPGGDPSKWNQSTADSTKVFVESVARTLKFLSPINPAITITGGGEPTLSPRLPAMLEEMKRHSISKLVINTNGSRLLEKAPGEAYMVARPSSPKFVLDHLLDAGLNHLNVSVSHYDPQTNARLMEMPSSVGPGPFRQIVREAIAAACRPRLSLVLLKDGISEITGLKTYLNWAIDLGIDDVLVRELAGYDLKSVRAGEAAEYTKRQRVPLNSLLDQVQEDPDFTFIQQKSGKSHYRENYRYRNSVDIGFAVYRLFTEEESRRVQDKAKWFVLQPTGSLNTGWEDWDTMVIPPSTRSA